MSETNQFDDIRPYNDDEVKTVLNNLINETELQTIVANYLLPKANRWAPWLCRLLVKLSFRFKVRHFNSVAKLQREVVKYLNRLIKKSTDGFSHHGLAQLDMSKPCLFVSNHRDIALDPALVNYALNHAGSSTAEIAIGDNLLTKAWLSDLMRLNKSFIVKRGETGKRAILQASKQLSAYIHYTLYEKKQHIWIAQREGRAKNGLDKTNSAVISMLLLNRPKTQSIADYLNEINIVPVSISYQFDPCDTDKAKELAAIELNGEYKKAEHEDIDSIAKGLLGYKGRVHVEFGQPIVGDYADSKAIAQAIDQQIINNYKLTDLNQAAFELSRQGNADTVPLALLQKRMRGLNETQKKHLIAMYANPVIAKI